MTPTPGQPLSEADVLLLKGDLLLCPIWGVVRFDRFDDSQRRAFVLDLKNNQVRLMVPAKMTFLGRPDQDGAVWVPVPWASEWSVSNTGSVKGPTGKVLAAPPATKRGGYPTVRIGQPKRTKHVHVLVAEAFIGPRPNGLHIAHQDGDPTNNRVENLRYVTPRTNHLQKQDHGTQAKGETHHCAKLTEDDVKHIRAVGRPVGPLAKMFNVSRATVRDILNGKTWRSVQ